MSLETVLGTDGDFVHWLQQHPSRRHKLLELTCNAEGRLLASCSNPDWPVWEVRALERWLAFNQVKLSAGQYETVYFPRCVYGQYLGDLADRVSVAAAEAGFKVSTMKGRATGFSSRNPQLGPHTISVRLAAGGVRARWTVTS
jgi:hypothetical protein